MKHRLLILESKVPEWVNEGRAEYVQKLRGFAPFELVTIKSPVADRDSADVKRRKEAELILKFLSEREAVILFDEQGRVFKGSEGFAHEFARQMESGKNLVTFCIGGAYGFDESVRTRSQAQWSLSGLTMNHWVAQLMALEQLYRAWTIWRGIPYHNR